MKNPHSFFITLIFIVLTSCFNIGSHSVTSYYLDNETGNDDNPGTLKRPLKVISFLNSRLTEKPEQGLNQLNPKFHPDSYRDRNPKSEKNKIRNQKSEIRNNLE